MFRLIVSLNIIQSETKQFIIYNQFAAIFLLQSKSFCFIIYTDKLESLITISCKDLYKWTFIKSSDIMNDDPNYSLDYGEISRHAVNASEIAAIFELENFRKSRKILQFRKFQVTLKGQSLCSKCGSILAYVISDIVSLVLRLVRSKRDNNEAPPHRGRHVRNVEGPAIFLSIYIYKFILLIRIDGAFSANRKIIDFCAG